MAMDTSHADNKRSNLLFRLALFARRWRKIIDAEIQTLGLTDATWRPLFHLHVLGAGTRQKDLAESLGIKGPSLVRLLDTLLEKGLVRRIEDDSDRRGKLLFLTPEGEEQVGRIQEIILALEDDLFGKVGEGDILQMEKIITRLESSIGELGSQATDDLLQR